MVNPDKDIVVVKEALDVAGAVSYWRAGDTISIEALRTTWLAAGLDEKLLRKAPEPVTALRRAVMDQQGRHRLVRGVGKGEWAIVDEKVYAQEAGQPPRPPTYSTRVIVRRHDTVGFVVDRVDASVSERDELADAVRRAYATQQGLYDPSDVTGWLVDMAYKNNAVTLRESGGVYFLPKSAMDFWNRAAAVIESVSNNHVFRIPAMRNAEAIAAITDAVTAEAQALAAKFEEELLATGDDAIGKRAIETRKKETAVLEAKLIAYEELLGKQLEVRSRVEALQANLSIAALAAVGSEEQAA